MVQDNGLRDLHPAVASWFREAFGAPTPAQEGGWPAIAAGQNTLICAPTGSGKTLAAFLVCLDHLWRTPRLTRGVRVLYVSPLKALNVDVSRNLQGPLEGILAMAERLGTPLEPLRVAVRTGDTPAADRQRLVRNPPDILITTPESLHLMLTSRARETLRTVSHVLIDEIHALAPNKRGVFLALLLERLEALNLESFVRVGLSATQRPLEEVARYLGGLRRIRGADGLTRVEARPVTIIDAGRRKGLDLQVSLPGAPGSLGPVWPRIENRLVALIQEHRSTIIFTNNRRVAERITSHLNDIDSRRGAGIFEQGNPQEPNSHGTSKSDVDNPKRIAHAHHGSLSLDRRRETEEALKRGDLPAVVATASLELGIDMGAVDLVCQVESPGSIARGLQRVGRAGHLVGRSSKGRLLAKTSSDLLESAALARAMIAGEVETVRVPTGGLDVLAQQVIACVAVDPWDVPALFDLIRSAYPFRDLSPAAFESVLLLVSGRFHQATFRDLRPRISWDRIHNRLYPLPGTAQAALVGGGTIPDTGQYPLYLGEGGPKLGELDEEFVLERRVGETFVLGTSTWRIEAIDPQRVIVSRAEGRPALMPFWRGEAATRTPELGLAVGLLCRELTDRLDDPEVLPWLEAECRLDPSSARALLGFVARQVRQGGAVPDDRTILVETFRDPVGEMGLAVLSPFGGKFHHALKLALQGRLRQRLGLTVASLHGDDGVLIRLPQGDDAAPPLDLFDGLTADLAETLIRADLGESALFGLRFRQNAGRALLLPRPDPGKRAPLWLQRLRAKDLLEAVRCVPDFPIVIETYRECLDDDLDLPRLRAVLDGIANGTTRVVRRAGEDPSPFAADLIFQFTSKFLYEWDQPRRVDASNAGTGVDHGLLDDLLDPTIQALWLDPGAVGRVESRLRGVGHPPRTLDEMAEWLRRLGDLTPNELTGPMLGFLKELETQGRAVPIDLPDTVEPVLWISAEETALYDSAFANDHSAMIKAPTCLEGPHESALTAIVRRHVQYHALVGRDDLTTRYPIDPALATELLKGLTDAGDLIRLDPEDDGEVRWADRRNLGEVRRLSIALRRSESVAVAPEVFADYVARRQHVHPSTQLEGVAALELALEQLQGFAAPADLWESDVLPRRVRDYRPAWLDDIFASGGWTWRAEREGRGAPRLAIVPRDSLCGRLDRADPATLTAVEANVLDHLDCRGACFVDEVARGTGLAPSIVRAALRGLVRMGKVTNDRFDPVRAGVEEPALTLAAQVSTTRRAGRPRPGSFRRPVSHRPEGRWAVIALQDPGDREAALLGWSAALMDRYGVLSRETATLDPWSPPWRDLVPVLGRAELRGEVRRGYFVEGLSGVQYALPDAVADLARLAGSPPSKNEFVLLSSLDPANLYGTGAPLDVP
ncbi:MAG: DEAD/DEAH box helicase, partial [Isosphaeraceae bacterium]